MKIITWNVRIKNRRILSLIRHALSFAPDVLCLQEVPEFLLPELKKLGYFLTYSYDFIGKTKIHTGINCILTKQKPVSTQTVTYNTSLRPSIMTRVLYTTLRKITETHSAPIVHIRYGKKILQIASVRLSCAVGKSERIRSLTNLMAAMHTGHLPIICGDLNVLDPFLFNVLSGWLRGFTLRGYFSHERRDIERFFARMGLSNIFMGTATYITTIPRIQFDHILIPKNIYPTQSFIGKKLFGSDHRMLFAEIHLPSGKR